jgi:hypothetical protein
MWRRGWQIRDRVECVRNRHREAATPPWRSRSNFRGLILDCFTSPAMTLWMEFSGLDTVPGGLLREKVFLK